MFKHTELLTSHAVRPRRRLDQSDETRIRPARKYSFFDRLDYRGIRMSMARNTIVRIPRHISGGYSEYAIRTVECLRFRGALPTRGRLE